jgi:cell wall-associated NlpC family hydrolase
VKTVTDFEGRIAPLLLCDVMFAVATASLLTLVQQLSGTPYISGGDSSRGTDCSGLVSFVTNAATGRPVYGDRFNTGNIEGALKARGNTHQLAAAGRRITSRGTPVGRSGASAFAVRSHGQAGLTYRSNDGERP